jgi:hypothetical protein
VAEREAENLLMTQQLIDQKPASFPIRKAPITAHLPTHLENDDVNDRGWAAGNSELRIPNSEFVVKGSCSPARVDVVFAHD